MRYYGQKVIDNNLCKTYLNKIKEVNKNILDLLNPLNENDIFYIYSYKYGNWTKNDNKKEILIINKPYNTQNLQNKDSIIKYIRYLFDLKTGIYIIHCIDESNPHLEKENFIRTINNTKLEIINQNINNLKIEIKIQSLSTPKYTKFKTGINEQWGVFDIETYKNNEEIYKIYAVGFLINNNKDSNLYYIDKDLDSNNLMIKAIKDMLKPVYHNFIFYCHNFGK